MAADTDILVILMYHWKDNIAELTIGIKKNIIAIIAKTLLYWKVSSLVKKTLHPIQKFFFHIYGMDATTSVIYQKGF